MESKSGSYPNPNWIYDVYLSFRGVDTGRSFVSHLKAALGNAGVSVYMDDMLSKGESLEHLLLRAIEASRISIIVFSENDAFSKWGLKDLVKIMECRKTIGQIVVPVFYDVHPSDVRRLSGMFGQDFEALIERKSVEDDKLMTWRDALKEACNLSGFVVDSRYEYAVIKNIVDRVTNLLDRGKLFITKDPVGVKSRVQNVIKLLARQLSEDVIFLGMFGVGGIGKTTIAKAVFNQIGHTFEGRSFLGNITESWKYDPTSLQQRVLDDIYKMPTLKIENIESGKHTLRKRLVQRKVLLVFDDVNELDQLNALCGNRNWFGPGSRIIITTRDVHVLRMHGVNNVYRLKELNENESLELFSRHAFKQISPRKEVVELSKAVVAYSGGLPLALEVLGDYLFDRSIEEWKTVLRNLKHFPESHIQNKLKISFDDLQENEKEIFLDIACFFIGMDQNDVIHILNGCGLLADIGISILVQRSLLTIDKDNKIGMIQLLRDMGREIVREVFPHEPEKRSRLWLHTEVLDVLSNYEGTKSVKGLALKLQRENTICLNTKAFKKMKRLRLLQLDTVQLDGDYKYLPRDLRYLCWHGFPLTYIPAEFHLKSSVVIELKFSNLKKLWETDQMLENLKVLNLSHSQYLTTIPNFSYLPNLEKLVLEDCTSLSKVSDSIGYLNKLLLLNLRDCTGLHNLPRSIYTLKCLKELILSGCSLIDKLEEDLEQMESLTTLIADKTAITKVPLSIVRLKHLRYISINGYEGHSHDVIPSIDWSRMSPKNNLSSQFPNDVFLSFRGEDTRASFTSHLYDYLQNAKINVFMDDRSLQMGDQISTSLLQAIQNSRISIVVFSRNYTDSGWCVRELEKIMECHRTIGQILLPVFYYVKPSDVRGQTGNVGEAFRNLLNRISAEEKTVQSWRMALCEAGGISGTVLPNCSNHSTVIKNIVERVTRLLNKTELFVPDHLVGMESHVKAAIEQLSNQQSKVLFVGIRGMGGIGKTTIAKTIYNLIGGNFDHKIFLSNIREVGDKHANQVSLQQLILDDICKESTVKIHNIALGQKLLQERLAQKKVLLVLDDVDKLDQLNALCESHDWFGSGSRVIITTRNRRLFVQKNVDLEYEIGEMNKRESLELFCWHAFKQNITKDGFVECSDKIVDYSKGLPLALEVLGSYLFCRPIEEWNSLLKRLETIPDGQVQEKLKISYYGLDPQVKEIFLDISCFFIGMDRNYVIDILNGCGFAAEIGISDLVERSLVTIDSKNKLQMHDLLRNMGREIICEESRNDPWKRSRLWLEEEVENVLSNKKGTETIKGLTLLLNDTKHFKTKTFKKMHSLRLLQLASVQLDGDYKYLSKDLKWLYWSKFPLSCIPAEFYQRSLVAIELKHSSLKQIWTEDQKLDNLKVLNLSHSHDLTKTPDFSSLTNLEKLVLEDCPNLSTVSNTIGCLHKLLLINLKDCKGLDNLPISFYKLKSLEKMILSGCEMIDKLEEDLEHMESLTILIADGTNISEVPFSIVKLKKIAYISLCGFEGFSWDVFPSLIRYWRSKYVGLSRDARFAMSSLVPYSSSYVISSTSKNLPKLQRLCVESGSQFQLTHDVEKFLDILKATNYKEREASATASEISDMNIFLSVDCHRQVQISKEKAFLKSVSIQMGTKCQAPDILEGIISQTMDGLGDSFLLRKDNYSDWSTFSCNGSFLTFELPQMNGCSLNSMILRIDYSSSDNIASEGCQNVWFVNYTKRTILVYNRDTLTSFEDEEWQSISSNLEPGNKVEVIVVLGHGLTVEKTTIYLKYDEPIGEEMEHRHAIDKNVTYFGDNGITTYKNLIVYCGDDLSKDTHIFLSVGDENESDNNHCLAGEKDVIVSDDGDATEDKNFTISSGDKNAQVTLGKALTRKPKEISTASKESSSSEKLMEGLEAGSILVHLHPPNQDVADEKPLIPLSKRKASNNQVVQSSSKQIEISTEPIQCSSLEMNQDINQNMEVDDSTNPDTSSILPNLEQMQVEGNVHIFKHQTANLRSEENALSSKNQTVEESRPIDPPHSITMQVDNEDPVKEQSTVSLQVVPKFFAEHFDFEAMNQLINDDPLSAIENMLSGEISVSSKLQQSTTQVDTPEIESSLVNNLLEDLKIQLFNKENISDALLHDLDVKEMKFIFNELSKVHDHLPAATRAFISQSHKFFNEALSLKTNYAHAISRLSSYEQTKKEFAEKAQKMKESKTRLATSTASSQEKLQVFSTQIVALEKQLEDLRKERDILQQDMSKCEEQRQNIDAESEILAHQTLSILMKIKEAEDEVETATVGVEVSKAIFEKLKSKVPF